MDLRPTGIIGWADSGTSVEPTTQKKALGWGVTGASGERPPAEYFNWIQQQNDAWLRYLSYDRVVDDDFAGASGIPVGWESSGSPTMFCIRESTLLDTEGVGVVVTNSPSGTGSIFKPVGLVADRDFFLSVARCQDARQVSQSTGIRVAFGVGQSHQSAIGPTGMALFITTGTSGYPWTFVHHSTRTAFSIYPTLFNGSGLQIFNVERRGATLTASIRCPVSGYEEKSFIAESPSHHQYAYIASQHYGSLTTDETYDYFRFGVRRSR